MSDTTETKKSMARAAAMAETWAVRREFAANPVCCCGCGTKLTVAKNPEHQRLFCQGHDGRLHKLLRQVLRGEASRQDIPAAAASRLQLAPPVGLLARVGEGVQNFSVFLHETDPCQVRPRRRRNVLSGRLAPKHLTQQLVEPPVVALTKQALMLRVLANRQLRAAAAAAHG